MELGGIELTWYYYIYIVIIIIGGDNQGGQCNEDASRSLRAAVSWRKRRVYLNCWIFLIGVAISDVD